MRGILFSFSCIHEIDEYKKLQVPVTWLQPSNNDQSCFIHLLGIIKYPVSFVISLILVKKFFLNSWFCSGLQKPVL